MPQNPCECHIYVGRLIDTCQFVNCCSERIRRYLENESLLGETIDVVVINTTQIAPTFTTKQIVKAGLATIALITVTIQTVTL